MKRERAPTREEYEKLLIWLDPDCDKAGERLRAIHVRLTQIFASRGCVDAETLADEVINRVAVRIDTVSRTFPDPLRCCIGFVGNVYREYLREERKKRNAKPPPQPRPAEILEREDNCLRECLETLTERDRVLLVRYFGSEGKNKENRKKLAADFGLTANALRIQAHRSRKKLLQCLQSCLDKY